jgi:hypothetical protein
VTLEFHTDGPPDLVSHGEQNALALIPTLEFHTDGPPDLVSHGGETMVDPDLSPFPRSPVNYHCFPADPLKGDVPCSSAS